MFAKIDTSLDGNISSEELAAEFASLKQEVTEEEIALIMGMIDENKNDLITKQELYDFAFNQTNVVPPQSLAKIVYTTEERRSATTDQLMQAEDTNGDGQLDRTEFTALLDWLSDSTSD